MKKSTARSYEAPAVVYEATLVAHAGHHRPSRPSLPGCLLRLGDVLDPTKGN